MNFADTSEPACPVVLLHPDEVDSWRENQPKHVRNWLKTQEFSAKHGQVCMVPGSDGALMTVLVGLGDAAAQARSRFMLAGVAAKLPEGVYKITSEHALDDLGEHALGWLLSHYSFERYKSRPPIRRG